MPVPSPVLDSRALKDILRKLREQAETDVLEWTPPSPGEDAGTMLHRIFARMLELALLRLNQAPEKNLLAFLDTMGISLLAPSSAKVPLTFSLTPGTVPTLVSKGAQAGTQASGQTPAVIFETEDDLTVLPAKLATGFIIDPKWDRFADQTAALAGQNAIGFAPFVGLKRMPHVLYFGDEALLSFAKATIELNSSGPIQTSVRDFLKSLLWQSTRNGQRTQLTAVGPIITQLQAGASAGTREVTIANLAGLIVGDTLRISQAESVTIAGFEANNVVLLAAALQNAYSAGARVEVISPFLLRLAEVEAIDATTVRGASISADIQRGLQSRWLQAVLASPFPDELVAQTLRFSDLKLKVSASNLLPDFAFHNTEPLELTRHFRPFGDEPRVGDTFYIASREAFSKPGVKITLNVEVKTTPPFLIWEYWSGSGWTNLPHSFDPGELERKRRKRIPFLDGDPTESFIKEGANTITLPRPGDMALRQINEETAFWFRVHSADADGGYPGAPLIKKFALKGTTTKLTKPPIKIDENKSQISVEVTDEVPQFASIGAVLSIKTKVNEELFVEEFVQVVKGVSIIRRPPITFPPIDRRGIQPGLASAATTSISLMVSPVLTGNLHGTDPDNPTEVKYHGVSMPIATIVEAVTLPVPPATASFFKVNIAEDIAPDDVLMIDDLKNREFVHVIAVEPELSFTAQQTSVFGTFTFFLPFTVIFKITTKETLKVHAKDVSVRRVIPYFVGYAENERIEFDEVDPTKPETHILPFGERPGPTDFFYFGTTAVFPPQIKIGLELEMTSPNVALQWEFFSASGWQLIPPNEIADGTNDFVRSGNIALPARTHSATEVNGQSNYWIRVLILSGHYGLPIGFEPVDERDPAKGFKTSPRTGNLRPPVTTKLRLNYEAERTPKLITQNGFLLKDEAKANVTAGGFVPYVSVRNLTPDRFATPDPAFYLGFDAAFPEQPVTLYVAAAPRAFSGSVINEARNVQSPSSAVSRLLWEYFDGTTWRVLPILDGTNNLTESGLVEFLTPTDMAPFAKFDPNASRYWIRGRSAENDPFDTQQLFGVFPNTIPAIQAVTVQNETIGSSSGEPDQIFRLTKLPVLPGQQVYVREAEPPSDQEREAIKNEEGDDAIQERVNSITAEPEVWVRWHEVPSFLRSSPFSRHYTFDHTTGLFKFGDQKFGQIPPRGTNNLIATYRNGGGSAGNVAKGGAAQVKTSVSGIASVTNPVAGDGGAEVETIALVKERGPQVLKHRNRAVTCSDLEWLARQAAGTRVARAYCLPNVNRNLSFEPGWATLIIIPQGAEARLLPSSELIRQVEDYLEARTFVGQAQAIPAQINVIGPGYVQVQVIAEVVPEDIDEAEAIKRRVRDRLIAFFHPLTGGPNSTGWAFSRDVYESEVSKIIEEVPGVSHVKKLDLMANVAQRRLLAIAPPPNKDLPEGSAVMTPARDKAALLAESLKSGAGITHIRIKGFKEGDRISKALDLIVQSVSGTTITVQSFNSDAAGFPRGSLVTSFDGVKRTQLAEAIPRNQTGLRQIVVEAGLFEAGEVFTVFYPFPITVTAVKVEPRTARQTLEIQPYEPEAAFPSGSLLTTLDNRVRMPLAVNMAANQVITSIQVFDFVSGDEVSVARRDQAFATEARTIDDVSLVTDVIYLDDNFLPYSGAHQITMVGS